MIHDHIFSTTTKNLKGFFHTEDENKHSHERVRIIKPQEKRTQLSEISTQLIVFSKTLAQ
jgi:hypothetical protein